MSLVELKQQAKAHLPKIKHYYINTRLELIKILSLKELPSSMILEKKTIDQLREEARGRNFPNLWKLRRAELVELLYPSSEKNDKNDDDGEKHDDPQKGECE